MMVTVKRSTCTIPHGQILWTDIRRLIGGIYDLTHCSKIRVKEMQRILDRRYESRSMFITVTAGNFLRRAVEGRVVEYSYNDHRFVGGS